MKGLIDEEDLASQPEEKKEEEKIREPYKAIVFD